MGLLGRKPILGQASDICYDNPPLYTVACGFLYRASKIIRNHSVSFCIFVTEQLLILMRRDVFQAIADPNRRAIINLLSNRSLTVNEVAESFDVSRPAISKHIKILQECGIINVTKDGRERHCKVEHDQLKEVSEWVDQYRKFWSVKLDALGKHLEG